MTTPDQPPKKFPVWLLLVVGVLSLGGLLAGMGALLNERHDKPGVTWANYQKIHEGMALTEVEAILGPAHGLELTGWNGSLVWTAEWRQHDSLEIFVEYDSARAVLSKKVCVLDRSLLTSLRRMLGL